MLTLFHNLLLFVAAAPPYGKKAYFHLWAADVNSGSTLSTHLPKNAEIKINVHVKPIFFFIKMLLELNLLKKNEMK